MALKKEGKGYNFIFLIYLFLIGGQLLYNIVLVSAMHQHESFIRMHMPPPSWPSLPSPTPAPASRLSEHRVWSPCITQHIPTGSVCYIRWCACFNAALSIHPTVSFPHRVHSLFSMSASLHCCPANGLISTIFLDSIHTCWRPISVFLFLPYFTLYNRLWVHPEDILLKWYLEGFLWVFNWSLDLARKPLWLFPAIHSSVKLLCSLGELHG